MMMKKTMHVMTRVTMVFTMSIYYMHQCPYLDHMAKYEELGNRGVDLYFFFDFRFSEDKGKLPILLPFKNIVSTKMCRHFRMHTLLFTPLFDSTPCRYKMQIRS